MGNSAPPPSGGLAGNSNYCMWGDGQPLLGVSVTVDVTQELVGNIGFSIQLNAYSPSGSYSAWQQYNIIFETSDGVPGGGAAGTLYAQIEPWPVTTAGLGKDTTGSDLINKWYTMASLPGSGIPAGYKLTISLGYTGNNVSSATFIAIDNTGKTIYNNTIQLVGLPLDITTGAVATTNDLAPIIAFVVGIVGPTSGEQALMLSGAGTIWYESETPLIALNVLAPKIDLDWVTVENMNSVYGEVQADAGTTLAQSFSTGPALPFKPGGGVAVSQQFGLNQTDVFSIGRSGQLAVFYVDGSGKWGSAPLLGPQGLARPGAAVAADQQFGAANQTDVFVVGQNGQLNVFWVETAGAWQGPVPVGPASNAPSGAGLAACQQFGAANQTDVFLFDGKGRLNVFWVESAGSWNGPVLVGPQNVAPSGAPVAASKQFGLDQTDVFVVGNDGKLNVYWVDGAGNWNGPETLGRANFAPAGAGVAVSQQIGIANQTDVFVVDNTGRLNVFWVQGNGGWNGPVPIGPAGVAPPGSAITVSQQFGTANQTDVFVLDNQGQLNVYWVQGAGAWNGPVSAGPAHLAPGAAAVVASQQFGITNQTDVFVVGAEGQPNVLWVDSAGRWNGPQALG